MLPSSGANPPGNAGGAMPRQKTRSEVLQAALKRRQLEVVPHKQMKNFMTLKEKIINTDELIKRYRGKVAEVESSRRSLKEAQSQVETMEQSMKGLRAELQALHEENEQLNAKLLLRDSELETMQITNHEDTLLIDQMTIQLKENIKIKEEYDLLFKTQNHTSHECEKWKKLYQKFKKEYDTLKSSKGGTGRHQSLRVRRPSDICSLPPLNSPPYRGEMFSGDSDIRSINSPASVFSLPVQVTHSNNCGRFAIPVNETEILEEKSHHHIVSPVSTKESNNDSCFSPPVENGHSTSKSSVKLANGSHDHGTTVLEDDKTTFSCNLLDSSTKKMESIEEVICIENGSISSKPSDQHSSSLPQTTKPSSSKTMIASETTKLKNQLFGEEDSDDDNLSVSDSSSCCSESSLSSVDDLADLLSADKNERPTGKGSNDILQTDCKSLPSEPLNSLLSGDVDASNFAVDVMEVDLSEGVENSENIYQQSLDVKSPTANNDVCMTTASMDVDHGKRTSGHTENVSVSCDAVVVVKENVIGENHLTGESAQFEMDTNEQQLCDDLTASGYDLSNYQQPLSPLQSFNTENQPSNTDEQPSLTIEEDQVLIVDSQQLSDLASERPSDTVQEESQVAIIGSQPVTLLPQIEVAAAGTASGEDSDEELDSSFTTPFQFCFETLSPMPPSPDNSHAELYTPLSPIPLTSQNQQQTLSPLHVSPLKSLSPLPQSPDDKSQCSDSPISAHHRPPEQPQAASSGTCNPSPIQFVAVVPMGVQTPTPCCVEVNVTACGGTSSPAHSPTKSTSPMRRQLRLSDSSPFSPPCQSTSISRPSELTCTDGNSAICVSPPTKFLATPLIVPSNVTQSECAPPSNGNVTKGCVPSSPDVDNFLTERILSSHSETPAIEDSELADSIDPLQSTPAVSNRALSVNTEVDVCKKICPDKSATSVKVLSPLVMDQGEFTDMNETPSSVPPLTLNNTASVKSEIKLKPLRKEVVHEEEASRDKTYVNEKALLSSIPSLFEDGEIPNDSEQLLQTPCTSKFESADNKREEALTVNPRDVLRDVNEEQMETQQGFAEHSLSSSNTTQTGGVCAKKIKKNPKYIEKKPRKNFKQSNSMTTSSFDELLSCFSSQVPQQSQSQAKRAKVSNVLDTRKLSPPKRKQMKKSLPATNILSSLAHLRNAALETRHCTEKRNTLPKHEESSCIDNPPTKQIAIESKSETASIPVVPSSSTDATPVHMLPGYQLRSREVGFWEKVPRNVRKRSLSGGCVSEPPHPQKIRKMSDCSNETNTLHSAEMEMLVLQSNESGMSPQDDSSDGLQVVFDSDIEVKPEQTSAIKTHEPPVLPTSSTKSQISNGERSADSGVRPKRLVRQTDGATGQEEDQTPANSPKGFEDGPVKKFSCEEQSKPLPSVASLGYGHPQISSPTILKGGKDRPQNGCSSPDDDVFSMPLPLVGKTVSSQQHLPNSTHMGRAGPPSYVLSPAQQQLNVCMQCHLPLPEWLVSAMTKVQSMHQHCSASGRGVGKKKRSNMKNPIMKQPKQKSIDYIMLNLERMVCGHLHLSAMITMFTNQQNVPNLPVLVQATMRFVLDSYNPKTEHVVSLYHSLCDAVRKNPAVLNPYASSFPPSLLKPECQLVALFAHICRMSPPMASVLTELNKALYQAILQPNLKFHKLAALIRLFTAICRLQDDKDRLLFLCFDLIKKPLQQHELPVIGGVASVWPLPLARKEPVQLFNSAKHLSCKGLEQQVLSYTLEVVVMRMFNSQKTKLHDSFPKNLYTLCHWNTVGSINQVNHLTETLIEVLKTSKSTYIDAVPPDHTPWRRPCPSILAYHVVQSLRLLGFQQGWVWTNDTLIRAHVWPLLQQWNKDRDSVREAAIACTVRLIGFVSKQGLSSETGSQSILQLQKVLKALLPKNGMQPGTPGTRKIPLHIQLAAIDSLFELCPPSHPNAKNVMDSVKVWLQAHSSLPCGAVLMKEFEPQLREFAKHAVMP